MGEITNGKMEQYVHNGSMERACNAYVSIEELNRGGEICLMAKWGMQPY